MTQIFRKGDVVTFTGTVRYDAMHDGKVFVDTGPGDGDFSLLPADQLKIATPTFEVGDRVRIPDGPVYDLLSIDEKTRQWLIRSPETDRLTLSYAEEYDWQRVPPVDEIAEQIDGNGRI